jgi:hypothetical protein
MRDPPAALLMRIPRRLAATAPFHRPSGGPLPRSPRGRIKDGLGRRSPGGTERALMERVGMRDQATGGPCCVSRQRAPSTALRAVPLPR